MLGSGSPLKGFHSVDLMRSPLDTHQRDWQHEPLGGHGGLRVEGSGEADLLKEAAKGEGGE